MIGLYAIAQGAGEAGTGARGERLRVVGCCGLQLVCGAPPPGISAEALRAHEAAVRRIADQAQACLPARFGACAASDDELKRLVEARAAELTDALRLVRGREQMTMRIAGPAPAAARSGGPGTRYLEERRLALTLPALDPLRATLADVIRAERIEPYAEAGLVASVFHLIDRGSAPRYLAAVESVELDPLRVSVSGPWPAWSFAPELSP